MTQSFPVAAEALAADLVELRRTVHAAPEIGLDLPATQAAVLAALDGLDLEIGTGRELSSVVAVLRGERPGPTVLLRADMDALPVREATGLDFASANGAMHACGHDLHVAGLVGAARLLHARRAELPGTVVLAFQPGEEGSGGARLMLAEGLLDAAGERPVAAYALHVDPTADRATLNTRPGPIMASSNGLRLRVHATGGHAALPHRGTDPVPVAAEIVLALQSFVTRRIPAGDPAVVSVVKIVGDAGAPNVIPAVVDIGASVRTLSRDTLELVRRELPALAVAIGAAHGCTVEADFATSYPVTRNDPAETERALEALEQRHGPDVVRRMDQPLMASEDFSYMLDEVPGTFVIVGARPPDVPATAASPLHSPTALFDDSVLAVQATAFAELAWSRLGGDPEAG